MKKLENEGEGNRTADRQYTRAAREFIDEGRVEPAAQEARAAEDAGPVPSFWNDDLRTGWDRVKDALRHDWQQTKADLHMKSGLDRGQDVGDTVKEATGRQETWTPVRHALQLGFGAAHH